MDTMEFIKASEFWQENRPFFDAKVLRIIYTGEKFCICNMANSSYVTFDLSRQEPGAVRTGLRSTVNQVRALVEDEGYYLRWLDHLYKNNTWQKRLVKLDQETLTWMQALKMDTDANGPGSYVDLELENQIFQRSIANDQRGPRRR